MSLPSSILLSPVNAGQRLVLGEGEFSSFSVWLSSRPLFNVTVKIAVTEQAGNGVNGVNGMGSVADLTVNRSSLLFLPSTWNESQVRFYYIYIVYIGHIELCKRHIQHIQWALIFDMCILNYTLCIQSYT